MTRGYDNGTTKNVPHFPRQGWRAFRDAQEMRMLAGEYFLKAKEDKEPALMTGLALYLGFSGKTLAKYANAEYDSPGDLYSEVLEECKTYVEHGKLVGGILGTYNATIIKFDLGANHGYAERKAVEVTGVAGAPIQTEDVTAYDPATMTPDVAARRYKDACEQARKVAVDVAVKS